MTIIFFHSLLALANSFDMVCKLLNAHFAVVGDVKSCYSQNLTIQSPDDGEIIVDSINGDNKTVLEDVHSLWVNDGICNYIPQNIATFMPNLKALRISYIGLKTISKHDLAPFPELVAFEFYGNSLEYIDGDIFSLNTKIQSIYLQDSNLFVINGPIFEPLKSLNFVEMYLTCDNFHCTYSACIPYVITVFKQKCEFDSIFPGFKKYYEDLKRDAKKCNVTGIVTKN